MKLMKDSLGFMLFIWIAIGVISLFNGQSYTFEEWWQGGVVLVVVGFVGGLLVNAVAYSLLATSGESYQASYDDDERPSQPRIETIDGEVVDDSYLPLYARNPTKSKRLPAPKKNRWADIPNFGFAGTTGGLEFFNCPQCGHSTPHYYAEKDTYVCKGDNGHSCGNVRYIGNV